MFEKSIFRNYPKTIRVLLHVSFWIFFMGTIASMYNNIDPHSTWILFLKDLVSTLLIFYFTAYFVIPKLLVKKKYLLSGILFLVMYFLWVLLSKLAGSLTLQHLAPNEILKILLDQSMRVGYINWYRYSLLTSYRLDFVYLIGLPLALKLVSVIINENKLKTNLQLAKMELELVNKEMELTLLKYQLNPHFLFNTLNNIYILVKQQDTKGAESIMKMTTIMRYLLYISNKPEVSIKDEIDFIEDYIDLERLRFDNNIKIDVVINLDSYRYSIVPIILFPFIENAFKHSSTHQEIARWIKIEVLVYEGLLQLNVLNTFEEADQNPNYVGGVGNENAKKRLELNYEKSDYTLKTDSLGNIFKVSLSLRLE